MWSPIRRQRLLSGLQLLRQAISLPMIAPTFSPRVMAWYRLIRPVTYLEVVSAESTILVVGEWLSGHQGRDPLTIANAPQLNYDEIRRFPRRTSVPELVAKMNLRGYATITSLLSTTLYLEREYHLSESSAKNKIHEYKILS